METTIYYNRHDGESLMVLIVKSRMNYLVYIQDDLSRAPRSEDYCCDSFSRAVELAQKRGLAFLDRKAP